MQGKVVVHGAEEVLVRSKNEVFDVLDRGAARRQIAETELNASSRSIEMKKGRNILQLLDNPCVSHYNEI